MTDTDAAAPVPPLLPVFCIVAATATSDHADKAQALEWAAVKPTPGAAANAPPQTFWRGVKLHPDDIPLFRRLQLGLEFESLRRQGKSIHEAFGDLLVFSAGAPLICVDRTTAALVRRMGRGIVRQPIYSLADVAAIALPTVARPTLAILTLPSASDPAGSSPESASESSPEPAPAPTDAPEPAPAEILDAAHRVQQGLIAWRALENRLRALPLPVLTEINFLPGIAMHPIQDLLRAAEKQALGGIALGVIGGAGQTAHAPGVTAVGPGSQPSTLEDLWQDFSEIIDPKAEQRMARGYSMESAAAEARNAETPPPDTDTVAPVTEAEIRAVFAPDGPLSKVFTHYEMRAEQVDMAVAVGAALSAGRHLLIEAGTGTGKSLAYLVPAVLFSLRNKAPVVISTHTKTLQGQLMTKDIPILRKALGKVFKAALLKGRSNYLCLRKFNDLLRNANSQLEPDDYEPMPGVVAWATATGDGDVERCGAVDAARDWRLWSKMHTVGADCLARKCRYYTRCFVFKARGEARTAHVIVANHALVFASLGREQGALPALKHVIFDEAHGLEDVATDFLSIEFDRMRLIRQLNRFAREAGGGAPGRTAKGGGSGGGGGGGILNQLATGLEKTRSPLPQEVLEQATGRIEQAREAVLACGREVGQFEDALGGLFAPAGRQWTGGNRGGTDRRGREFVPESGGNDREPPSGGGSGGSGRFPGQKLRYSPDRKRDSVWAPIHAARDGLIAAIAKVLKPLKLIHDDFELLKAGRFNGAREIEHELKAQLDFLAEIGQDLDFLVRGDNPDYVYWAEQTGGPRPKLTLTAAPLKINQMLNEQLWQHCRSAVLTSATLTSEGGFDFIRQRLGLDLLEKGRLESKLLHSSFAYREQCRILVPAHVSAPDQQAFSEQFQHLVFDAVTASRGRALVLFTSYVALNEAAQALTGPLAEHGVAVLAQGRDGSREQLLAQMLSGTPCAIFGTASFWEGIDVPGEALSLLIAAKLPFPAFKDPLWEARRETLEAEGRSAFQHLDIPVAVLKLRQGFGRLIRSRQDRGVFILADTRVLSRRYGWAFLQALPRQHEVLGGQDAIFRTIDRFFAQPAAAATGSGDGTRIEYEDDAFDGDDRF